MIWVHKVFGQIQNTFWQIAFAIGQFFNVLNGQLFKKII